MKKFLPLLFSACFYSGNSYGQNYIEPLIGFQFDISNQQKFRQINLGVQYSFNATKLAEPFLQLKLSLPISLHSNDSSFTLNQAMPLYSNAAKSIKPATINLAIGERFKLLNKSPVNKLSILVFGGVSYQHIAVDYNYDKTNYTVLNPDKTLKRAGVYLGTGLEYLRQVKDGRFFVQIGLSSPPVNFKKINFPSSFHYISPISFDFGYSIE